MRSLTFFLICCAVSLSCSSVSTNTVPEPFTLSREAYQDRLEGFWLGACVANWTGLVTEMDKIGNVGEIKTGDFYTREDWGKPDQPSIWGEGSAGKISPTIDFVLRGDGEVWGADDDTDIEYMYQHLMWTLKAPVLSPEQIREGWLTHIRREEENYLWVSNQQAFDLMVEGVLPPETADSARNPHVDMIDAQLTTEIFGLLAPARPDVALQMAHLPIRTTARKDAAWISEFYVIMHALAVQHADEPDRGKALKEMAQTARIRLPNSSYAAAMYDYVWGKYQSGIPWEQARDSVYVRYQVEQKDGYTLTDRNLYCNGCFAAGINFAASLVSLFYGEGDLKETLKIGALAGWDSDNPTATWGGLIGFMLGKKEVEETFGRTLSHQFHIHRTRQGFPNEGMDTFENMAQKGIEIIDQVVREQMGGEVDTTGQAWRIPQSDMPISPAKD